MCCHNLELIVGQFRVKVYDFCVRLLEHFRDLFQHYASCALPLENLNRIKPSAWTTMSLCEVQFCFERGEGKPCPSMPCVERELRLGSDLPEDGPSKGVHHVRPAP